MNQLIYFVIIGLGIGAVYALAGLGVVTLFTGSGLANFAQGDLMVLGALVAVSVTSAGHGYVAGLLAAVAVVAVAGVLLGALFTLPMRHRRMDVDVVIIGTLGVATTMTTLAGIWWGRQPQRLDSPLAGVFVPVGEMRVPAHYVLLLVGAAVVFGLVRWFHRRTDIGLQLRAVASSVPAARDAGVRIGRMLVVAWTIAALVGGVAGVLVASVLPIAPESALPLGVNGFAAAIIGGLANPAGAVLGGLVVGLAETLAGGYLNDTVRQSVAPLVLLVVLVLRPGGLLGRARGARTV
ncbi:branched-chain amino acid transport system permease protein [Pseudonocardia thermophila]|uniref:Branched-chain amino acid transport system permease protein n=1 Tax=Pseudonocardia thermophila TaxID=1848 RepID=A0A1M6THZ2_PSETH|nr:branched-chain amino acid ABC transporter permease [Pseudonocardia thermophila]SHK56466.1 branched-chain amino acid transport system permease protein [Pseudonocardia thermophila]